ncbi:MAG TPA: DUF4038 domain-containing protein [Mycobacteriales bacterium]|nr:DUF4038 domain-containing protein [Mycobacteriales bacterium]
MNVSGHFLQRNGAPWFLLGDTAWELLHRLTEAEAGHYLTTRARQGFNTVLTVGISEFDGLGTPNAAGHLPFLGRDPRRPDERYWQHADRVIRQANRLGLTVGLLPTWGTYWHDEPAFFESVTAADYGRWIAGRYRNDDIIWILGGDRNVSTVDQRRVIDAFAGAIRSVVGDRQLITFHPRGQASSTDDVPGAGWLDFNLIQSSHTGWNTPNYQLIEQDYLVEPVKPVLDGEPNYENHPVMTPTSPRTGTWEPVPGWRFDDRDVRRAAYHAVFAGACGHVYGAHDIWQFFDPNRAEPINEARLPWRSALELPGANQLGHLARLVDELDLLRWKPDQSVLASGIGFLGSHQRAMSRADEAVVYTPPGREIRLRRPAASVRWWNPLDGQWRAEQKPAQLVSPFATDAVAALRNFG